MAPSLLRHSAIYAYNGTGDRLVQRANGVSTTYTLDLAPSLSQVLADGTYTYTYGLGRLAQKTSTASTNCSGVSAVGVAKGVAHGGDTVVNAIIWAWQFRPSTFNFIAPAGKRSKPWNAKNYVR